MKTIKEHYYQKNQRININIHLLKTVHNQLIHNTSLHYPR